MANAIYLESKDCSNMELGKAYAFGFSVKDGTTVVPATFKQTQALTSKYIGITEYGAMYLNDANVVGTGNIVITASPLDGSADVTATISLANLVALAVGSQVTQ